MLGKRGALTTNRLQEQGRELWRGGGRFKPAWIIDLEKKQRRILMRRKREKVRAIKRKGNRIGDQGQ